MRPPRLWLSRVRTSLDPQDVLVQTIKTAIQALKMELERAEKELTEFQVLVERRDALSFAILSLERIIEPKSPAPSKESQPKTSTQARPTQSGPSTDAPVPTKPPQ
jgi:hypothetical protein